MKRGFKKLDGNATIPERATKHSAGYDISASETVTLLNNLHHKITVESAQLLLTKFLTLLITTVPNSIKKEI